MGTHGVTRRKILFITGSRGEYGYIRPMLRLVEKSKDFSSVIIATNMHLLPSFGETIQEIENDGFEVKYKPLMALSGYTPASMTKSLCVFGLTLVDIVETERPDFILLAGDRGEQFMGALAGAHMNIPVAHIQAGEVSGNIDGQTRHAIARYAHIHFAANDDAAKRLIRSGEQAERVFNVGAPQLDEFLQGEFLSKAELANYYHIDPNEPFILLVQHPVTEEFVDAKKQMEITLQAVTQIGMPTVLIYPNNDAGSMGVQKAIEQYCVPPLIQSYRNVPRTHYAGLMASARVLVGNSSSGLLEAPSFELPTVDIGNRQRGRLRAENVLHCDFDVQQIVKNINQALSDDFKNSLSGMKNPYGDGYSSQRILDILCTIKIDEKLLVKKITY